MWRYFLACSIGLMLLSGCANTAPLPQDGVTPALGQQAPDFTLLTVENKPYSLKDLADNGPVVLVVLRGYPGYQCPICSRQVGDFIARADALADHNATVVLVYPGPAEGLTGHAEQFIAGKGLPDNFVFLTDPDYTFTNRYGLRWDAPKETAYPSTFIISKRDHIVRHAHISRTHGDRTKASEILGVLQEK